MTRPRVLTSLRPAVWLPVTILLAALLLGWQLTAQNLPYLLPPLQDVAQTLITEPGFYLGNAAATLAVALLGGLFGVIAAALLAIAVSESVILRRAIMPLAVVLNVTPLVAIAPALVVAFGFGSAPKLIITGLIVFFPVLINVAAGLRSVTPEVLQFYRVIHASRWELLWYVRMPTALPYLFAGLTIAFPLSLIGAVVAEMSAPGAGAGLGTVISVAASSNQLAIVYAAIAVLAMLGSLLLLIITMTQRRFMRWQG